MFGCFVWVLFGFLWFGCLALMLFVFDLVVCVWLFNLSSLMCGGC